MQCDRLMPRLAALDWERRDIKVGGRTVKEGRETCFYADSPKLKYRYSNTIHTGLEPMPAPVDEIRRRVEAVTGYKFNYVLGNRYPDGRSVIMWHSDDVRDLVAPEHVIASVSIGAKRKFQLRRVHRTAGYDHEYELPTGSCFVMADGVQERYKHRIVPDASCTECRYNLTFRNVLVSLAI